MRALRIVSTASAADGIFQVRAAGRLGIDADIIYDETTAITYGL